MKIVNNMPKAPKERPIAEGDIVIGANSGDYYLILENDKALNLNDMRLTGGTVHLSLIRTNITKENITITFE
ncbi:hypothetical protein [Paenibacillus sp. Soil724D2]|uniref:hypothetical protein n=1 Tax=Paenibacillus sp. (strain Soil724D2) TaxID=1736392 RepID=UPI00071309BC|nr:hypothetical protein [Paenibacillus sp. Soil724D2]KRE33448.1 hypothetical protein ASG85_14370 [Paenibacillus sp. Soil724D2]